MKNVQLDRPNHRRYLTRKIIAARLKAGRKQVRLTQQEAGEAMGLTLSGYASIERGDVNLHPNRFLVLCELFKLDPREVLTITDDDLLNASKRKSHD